MNTFNVIPWPIYDTQIAANLYLKKLTLDMVI
jgi:ribonuclease D